MIGLAVCLAGGIALFFFHRMGSPSSGATTNAIPVSPSADSQSDQPKISSAVDELWGSLDASATDEELLALARSVVARSPVRAIAWARSQDDSVLRRRLLSAVIRVWGESDPASAVDWALMQDDSERRVDMEAALAGAVKQPQLALAIVRRLLADDPDDGAGCGAAFVVALNNSGQFQTAMEFLNDGPADSRADWTTATFRRWGESRPQEAVQALASIADEKLRDAAFRAVVDGWSAGNPSALADYATSLPEGDSRAYALNKAIDNWSLQDPAGLGAWLNTSPPGVDFDQTIARLISTTDGANRTPEVAMKWVENISDPNLKYDTMVRVLGQWNQSDSAAAQNYVANASWLDDQQRQKILKSLQNPP
jgi:stage V sporulation protein SpoVS